MLGKALPPLRFFFLSMSGAAVAACSGVLRALRWRCGWSGSLSAHTSRAGGSDQHAPGDEGCWMCVEC